MPRNPRQPPNEPAREGLKQPTQTPENSPNEANVEQNLIQHDSHSISNNEEENEQTRADRHKNQPHHISAREEGTNQPKKKSARIGQNRTKLVHSQQQPEPNTEEEKEPAPSNRNDTSPGTTLATFNVRGIYQKCEMVRKFMESNGQGIYAITEANITNYNKHKLPGWLKEYTIHSSSPISIASNSQAAPQATAAPPEARAGVLLATPKHYAQYTTVRNSPEALAHRMVHVTISPPDSTTLHVIGVYYPAGTTPAEKIMTKALHETITGRCKYANTKQQPLIVLGDMNACLQQVDRLSRTDTPPQRVKWQDTQLKLTFENAHLQDTGSSGEFT